MKRSTPTSTPAVFPSKNPWKLIAHGIAVAIIQEILFLFLIAAPDSLNWMTLSIHVVCAIALLVPAFAWVIARSRGYEREIAKSRMESERLRSTFAAVAEGIIVQNSQGVIVDCNLSAQKILGMSFEEIIGRKARDEHWRTVNEDGAEFLDGEHPCSITLKTGKSCRNFPMGIEILGGDQRWLSLNTEAIWNDRSEVDSVVCSFVDVTESRDQARRLELIIESAGLGTWEWDIVTGRVIFSENWAKMLGYEVFEIEPDISTFEKLLNPNDLERVLHSIHEHLQSASKEYRCELNMRHKDGSWKWVLATGNVTHRNSKGEPLRMVGVHVDIQTMKAVEKELMDARLRAQAASSAKSEFLANMSHEIRTPMTAILGYADLLAMEGPLVNQSQRCREYIETIRRNGEQLLRIINDILDISKIEAGKMTAEKVSTNPAQLIQEVAALMNVRAQEKGLELSVVFETKIPEALQTDPLRLRQILINLVGNSLKFTDKGSVVIATGYQPEDKTLRIKVVDTGIGMSPAHLSQIFEAFTQGDASTTRKFGGTGLGLHISRRFAEILGGKLVASSKEGHGSTFELSIPADECSKPIEVQRRTNLFSPSDLSGVVADSQESSPVAAGPLHGLRILFAEDGPDNQKLFSFILRKAGANVHVVDNGRQAVQALTCDQSLDGPLMDPCPFDLLLTDMAMPELDGYETVSMLRAKGAQIPIIALTAHALDSDIEKCFDVGCNDCATKPANKTQLIDVCLKWAGTSKESSPTIANSEQPPKLLSIKKMEVNVTPLPY
jgi:PAS domain S-box-containing protein